MDHSLSFNGLARRFILNMYPSQDMYGEHYSMDMCESPDPDARRAREALARHDLPSAYQSAHVALGANPRNPHVHALLGVVLSEANDLSGGEWHLRRALELDEPQAQWLVDLAVNLVRQGRVAEADTFFARADALSPGSLQVLAQWSRACELRGDLQRAEHLLGRAAAASSPQDVELLRVILLARAGKPQEALSMLEAASTLSGEAQLERGRLYDRAGRYREAWHDWVEGKAKLAALAGDTGYRPHEVDAFFRSLKQFFTRANLELLPRAEVRGDVTQPVFIVGFPRSGTTLIEQVLAAHSAVHAGGELTFAAEWPGLVNRLLPGAAPFPQNLTRLWSADCHHVVSLLRDYYFSRAQARGLLQPGKAFFTDKMPFNEMWLPLVCLAFPHAKIVHVVRHPLDVCVSMLSHQLTHGSNCGYSLESIAHQLAAMLDLMQHYRRELDVSLFTVRYEDFVRHPEEETRRLLQYLELPFEPACLAFHETRRYPATPSYAQVTNGLNDRSIHRHRHYSEYLEPHVSTLERWLVESGYERERMPADAGSQGCTSAIARCERNLGDVRVV